MKIVKHTGLKRIFFAAGYSVKGLCHNFVYEAAFRQEVIVALILIPIALSVDVEKLERIVLIFSLMLVLLMELLNTAIEATVDRIGLEFHPLSGLAKDTGSAAVLMSVLLCLYTWVAVFFC
ncbi:diacylglycerol kinase [Marinomonas sp. 15G1-11]|uniref:Diacylglycerol kinase n=1 Tax=Marinomonas phaeophyticola TaxID=3004091 RepID=A0ABT4JRK8_9GAMM|nr:diacylglycerol kinase [Marinomonas sp. 15G1-11]MCZ2721013.1 diacylglycerol kinase [Marinomonas sp. 15G1-11]